MAESWIKMRGSLLTNPRVIKMARLLLQDPEFLAWFVNDGVTFNASQIVTNPSLFVTRRHVSVVTRITVGSLTPLWSSVNECASADGILHDASLFEIDEMAGVPGFGRAMEAVGWLEILPNSEGIEFPNFIEHNTVGRERSTSAKTPAERAKEYRERKRLETCDASRDAVTQKSDASRDAVTTEKSREEKISSSLRSEDSAAKPLRTHPRPKREEVTLAKYLENCKAAGAKPVPDAHAIRAWCVDAKIPTEMLQVAWVVFREKYTGDEKLKGKRYKDWAGHFANSVKDRWYGLWFTGEDGVPAWTSTGMQRKQVLDANQQKNQEASHEPA